MQLEEVTDEMLVRAGVVRPGAIKPLKKESEERRRIDSLNQARRIYIQRHGHAEKQSARMTDDQRAKMKARLEAIHGEAWLKEFVAKSCGQMTFVERLEAALAGIRSDERMAREAAALKGTLQELLKSEPKASKRRQLRIKMATPPWVDYEAIAELIVERDRVSELSGVAHHIDHIIPLAGKHVCGLHVHHNMRVITATANLKKNAKFYENA